MSNGREWTNHEIARLIQLCADGQTYVEIAAKMNRTEGAVRHKYQTLKLSTRPRGRPRKTIRETKS